MRVILRHGYDIIVIEPCIIYVTAIMFLLFQQQPACTDVITVRLGQKRGLRCRMAEVMSGVII